MFAPAIKTSSSKTASQVGVKIGAYPVRQELIVRIAMTALNNTPMLCVRIL